jgi:hypothetical protein
MVRIGLSELSDLTENHRTKAIGRQRGAAIFRHIPINPTSRSSPH